MSELYKSKKILTNKQEIINFCGITEATYYDLLKKRLPVFYIRQRPYAHTDNLEEYFKAITQQGTKELPEGIEEEN